MILHGIESPNLFKQNTLTQNIRDIQEKDRFDIILANPPFGGKEKSQIQQNFPVQATATELLFLQHFMKNLKVSGKAGIIVPEGVLFQTNNAFAAVKKELLENFNLHTIVSLPEGVFLPYATGRTNFILFDRNGSTSEIWYYEVNLPFKLTKNKPLISEHLQDFIKLFKKRSVTPNSWIINVSEIKDFDLSAKNPNKQKSIEHLPPLEILAKLKFVDAEISKLLNEVGQLMTTGDNRIQSKQVQIQYLVEKQAHIDPSVNPMLKYTYIDISAIDKETQVITKPNYFIGKDAPSRARKAIRKGDIVFATTRPNLKNIAIIEEDYENPIASTGLCVLRPKLEKIDHRFLYYYLIGNEIQEQIAPYIRGAQYPAISDKDLLNCTIPLPPLTIQIRIAEKLSLMIEKHRDLVKLQYLYSQDLRALKSSLLDAAFKGEL